MKNRLLLSFIVGIFIMLTGNLKAQSVSDSVLYSGVESSLIEIARLRAIEDRDSLSTFLNRAYSVYPESSSINYELATYYSTQLNNEKALFYALKADSISPDNYHNKLLLVDIYNSLARYQNCADIYEQLVEKYPLNEDFYIGAIEFNSAINYTKALDYMMLYERKFGQNYDWSSIKYDLIKRITDKDSVEGAKYTVAVINDLYMLDKDNPIKAIAMAITYRDLKLYDDSKKTLKDFEKRNGKSGIISLYRASEYLEKLDFKRFYKNALSGISDTKSNINYISDYLAQFIDAYLNYTNDTIKADYHIVLDKLMLNAREIYSDNFDICYLYSEWLRVNSAEGDGYINELKHILSFNKENEIIFENVIFYYLSKDDLEQSLYYSDMALKYFPDKAIFYYPSIYNAILNEDYQKSVELCEIAIQYVTKLSDLHLSMLEILSESYHEVGRNSESYEIFDYLLKLDPTNITSLNNYTYYLSNDNIKLDEAKKMSHKTILAEPNNPVYLDTYAWILYKLGEYSNAEKYMKKALDNMGDDSDKLTYYEHYSLILKANGKLDLAEEYENKVRELKAKME